MAPLVAAGALVAACAATPPNPDPGNKQLHSLASDPVFAKLLPGAVRTSLRQYPAKLRGGGPFEGGPGWDGPAVVLTFTSAESVDDVYRGYAQLAAQAGWSPYQKLSDGLTRDWVKIINGVRSTVDLLPSNFDLHSVSVTESGIVRSYTFGGSTY
jgi:hypothetical protein